MEFALGIHAYTLAEPSIYGAVHGILNSKERSNTDSEIKVIAALNFTKFIDEALKQLPSYKPPEGQPYVYRGIRYVHRDFKSRFADGTIFPWYTLKSASTGIEVLDTFCGQTGPRTVFEITVKEEDSSVKDISMFSAFPAEKEVLAPPSTMFKVTGQLRRDPEKHRGRPLETADVVKLEEIDAPKKQHRLCEDFGLLRSFAENALKLNPKEGLAWYQLGTAGGGTVGGKYYDKRECYKNALELDPTNTAAWNSVEELASGSSDPIFAVAWFNLGVVGGGSVGGVDYNKNMCYAKSLELNPMYAYVWISLGLEGGGSVAGVHYDKKTCYEKALELDPKHGYAWGWLAREGGGSVRGVDYNEKECRKKEEELEPINLSKIASLNSVIDKNFRSPDDVEFNWRFELTRTTHQRGKSSTTNSCLAHKAPQRCVAPFIGFAWATWTLHSASSTARRGVPGVRQAPAMRWLSSGGVTVGRAGMADRLPSLTSDLARMACSR